MSKNERFIEIRKNLGFTQKEFAEKTAISLINVKEIEEGRRVVSINAAEKLHARLGVNLNWFLSGEGESGLQWPKSSEMDDRQINKAEMQKIIFEIIQQLNGLQEKISKLK